MELLLGGVLVVVVAVGLAVEAARPYAFVMFFALIWVRLVYRITSRSFWRRWERVTLPDGTEVLKRRDK